MLELELRGEPYSKKEFRQRLVNGALHNRTEASIEFRMQNISAVLASIGRPYLKGYLPAANVGSGVAAQLLKHLAAYDPTLPGVMNFTPPTQTAPPLGSLQPERQERLTAVYVRDQRVVDWVLVRSQGICECCLKAAPFEALAGHPFLEVHHVHPLAEGGPDTIDNAVALCPNCHREVHYGVRRSQLKEQLQGYLTEIST